MPKRKETEAPESIFDLFGGPAGDSGEDGKPKKAKDAAEEADVGSLMKEIGRLSGQIEAMQAASVPKRQADPAPRQPQMPEVDLEGLPDRDEHPEQYAKELNKRMQAAITKGWNELRAFEAEQEGGRDREKARTEQLWADFSEQYEDLAAHSDVVEFAATKVARKAHSEGLDLDALMFGQGRKRYMADVAKLAKTLIPREAGEEAEDEDDGRTGGLLDSRGEPSGGKPKGPPSSPPKLTDDLAKVQRATGFM